MTRARTALAIALFGIVIAPFVGAQYGSTVGVVVSAGFAAVGIALFPDASVTGKA